MESRAPQPANVIRFPAARAAASSRGDQHRLLETIYAAGALPVGADDRPTKAAALRLSLFGFIVIDEMLPDGSARRLRPSEAFAIGTAHPWRISKPSRRPSSGRAVSIGGLPARYTA